MKLNGTANAVLKLVYDDGLVEVYPLWDDERTDQEIIGDGVQLGLLRDESAFTIELIRR